MFHRTSQKLKTDEERHSCIAHSLEILTNLACERAPLVSEEYGEMINVTLRCFIMFVKLSPEIWPHPRHKHPYFLPLVPDDTELLH